MQGEHSPCLPRVRWAQGRQARAALGHGGTKLGVEAALPSALLSRGHPGAQTGSESLVALASSLAAGTVEPSSARQSCSAPLLSGDMVGPGQPVLNASTRETRGAPHRRAGPAPLLCHSGSPRKYHNSSHRTAKAMHKQRASELRTSQIMKLGGASCWHAAPSAAGEVRSFKKWLWDCLVDL